MNEETLGTIRARALDYADMTGSDFPNTDRVNDYINQALAKLYGIMANSNQDYFKAEQTITLDSSTGEYALPNDYYKTIQMFYLESNRRYVLEPYNWHETSGYKTTPVSTGTVEHWYIPQFKKMKNDDETLQMQFPYGWDEYAALDAAIKLMMRERTQYAQGLMAERAAAENNIRVSIEPRVLSGNLKIEDVHGRWNSAQHYFGNEERYLRYKVIDKNISFVEFEYLGA